MVRVFTPWRRRWAMNACSEPCAPGRVVDPHVRGGDPYEHGRLSGVRYRGQQIAVATVAILNETHVFAASEARRRDCWVSCDPCARRGRATGENAQTPLAPRLGLGSHLPPTADCIHGTMKYLALLLLLLTAAFPALAAIPATPVMTLYRFNGDLDIPYYSVDGFARGGASSPAGHLAQGSSVIPCLVIHDGKPLTDSNGTPYVGFEVVVDARKASREATARFKSTVKERESLQLQNHHCGSGVENVLSVRDLYALIKPPFFDPPRSGRGEGSDGASELDRIVRAFHNSPQCERANRGLIGRRGSLERAWEDFTSEQKGRRSGETLDRAKHLDYAMRTALYEGHIGRGCSAYGACERNVVALSIRNRARGQCASRHGCRFPGTSRGCPRRFPSTTSGTNS